MEEIILLNGDKWNVDELLSRMEDDHFYYGYCNNAMFSSSKVKDMSKSPKSYYYIDKYKKSQQPLRDGTLFHLSILEPDKFDKQVFCPVRSKSTQKYRQWKEEHTSTVYTLQEKEDAERLAQAFLLNQKAVSMIRDSKTEVPAVGMIQGIPFRAKADVLTNNGRVIDLKTCQNITNFKKDAYALGYNVQAYLYCQLFNISYKDFYFIAIDKKSLDIGIYSCSKEFYDTGKSQVTKVLDAYKIHIHNKDAEDVKDFIDNYIFEDTL
jgi:hypothetical protein